MAFSAACTGSMQHTALLGMAQQCNLPCSENSAEAEMVISPDEAAGRCATPTLSYASGESEGGVSSMA